MHQEWKRDKLLVTTDPARIDAFQQRTGLKARILPTWEAVLRDPEIDAVDLCLPNSPPRSKPPIELFNP